MQDEQRDLCLSVAPGMPTAALRRRVRGAEHEARGKIAEASWTAADEVGQHVSAYGLMCRTEYATACRARGPCAAGWCRLAWLVSAREDAAGSAGRAEPTSTHLLVGMIVFQLETRTTGDRWEMRHDGQADCRRLRQSRIAARYD